MSRNLSFLSIILIVILAWTGCSNQKNTYMSRKYHNLTAHYNVYFNGRESFKKGLKKVDETVQDNYADVLPIFKYSDTKTPGAVGSDMDRTIKKMVKMIKKHSITVKPARKKGKKYSKKEREKMKDFLKKNDYCNWVDDAYLMMGKANFYKHDFYAALKSFEIIFKKFDEEDLKPDAILWTAKTYIEMKKYSDAKRYLDMFDAEKKVSKKLKPEYLLTYSDYYMRQKQYAEAVPRLEEAITHIRKKRKKARYKFILAQLSFKARNNAKAADLFKEVVELNPVYDMAFNAKINRAIAFSAGSEGSNEIKAQLRKMLKDEKNDDYQDQIYYALAEIAKKEGKLDLAVEYYKKAAEKSLMNDNQKAMAFLSLADIYFEKPEYSLSQAYYDSTIQYLSNTYSDYEKVEKKAKNLTALVQNLEIIFKEDSLQRIAKMSEKDRLAFVDKLIENVKKEEAEAKRKEEEAKRNMQSTYRYEDERNYSGVGKLTRGGKWYFYNTSSINFGKAEFVKKWGRRKLEDNWRRKNKTITMEEVEIADDSELTDSLGNVLTDKDRDYYLLRLPMSDSLMQISCKREQKAYYDAALVYLEKLEDFAASVEMFEKLNNKYTDGEYTLAAYYSMYETYKKMNKPKKSEHYKNLIISKYPNSEYAKRLTNPNYLKELKESKGKVERIYIQAYNDYKNKHYSRVIASCENANQKYPNNVLNPKFDFLRSLCIGHSGDTLRFKAALAELVKKYPESDVKQPAQDILDILDEKKQAEIKRQKELEYLAKQIYFDKPDKLHYYIVVVKNSKTDIEKLKFNILAYTLDNDLDMNVSIAPSEGFSYRMITVKSLENKQQAQTFFKAIRKNKTTIFKDVNDAEHTDFVITSENFATFFKDKNVDRYVEFFKENYK